MFLFPIKEESEVSEEPHAYIILVQKEVPYQAYSKQWVPHPSDIIQLVSL